MCYTSSSSEFTYSFVCFLNNCVLHRLPLQEKKDVLDSPMSVGDSSVLSMSVSNIESQLLEDDEDATVAQTDRDMFFHVVEYRQDIYEYMKEIEVRIFYFLSYKRKKTLIYPSILAFSMCM